MGSAKYGYRAFLYRSVNLIFITITDITLIGMELIDALKIYSRFITKIVLYRFFVFVHNYKSTTLKHSQSSHVVDTFIARSVFRTKLNYNILLL